MRIGDLPFWAEDLGVITPDVEELRDGFGFPGMRILQFAFGGDTKNHDLPHNYIKNCGRLHRNARQRHDRRLV